MKLQIQPAVKNGVANGITWLDLLEQDGDKRASALMPTERDLFDELQAVMESCSIRSVARRNSYGW